MTLDTIPTQTAPQWVLGSPEGRDHAPPGWVEIETVTGTWYRKTTPIALNTGWVAMGGSTPVPVNPFTNMALNGAPPPTDGSVQSYLVYDTDKGYAWYNRATLPAPVWRPL
jgi:hypothetical protein